MVYLFISIFQINAFTKGKHWCKWGSTAVLLLSSEGKFVEKSNHRSWTVHPHFRIRISNLHEYVQMVKRALPSAVLYYGFWICASLPSLLKRRRLSTWCWWKSAVFLASNVNMQKTPGSPTWAADVAWPKITAEISSALLLMPTFFRCLTNT